MCAIRSTWIVHCPKPMNSTLPEELLSEPYKLTIPYSSLHSCDLAEIIVPRPRFLFEITTEYVSVTVGSHIVRLLYHPDPIDPSSLPSKRTSNISLLTVYDTYGIVRAREFLHYLYYGMKDGRGVWLDTYLSGCAYALELYKISPTYDDLRQALDALKLPRTCQLFL